MSQVLSDAEKARQLAMPPAERLARLEALARKLLAKRRHPWRRGTDMSVVADWVKPKAKHHTQISKAVVAEVDKALELGRKRAARKQVDRHALRVAAVRKEHLKRVALDAAGVRVPIDKRWPVELHGLRSDYAARVAIEAGLLSERPVEPDQF